MIRLNICCGTNVFPNWINIDKTDVERDYLRHMRDAPPGFVWPPAQQPIADAVKAGKLEFQQYDARRGLLLWEDASVDAIYIGQAIEHFHRFTEGPALLRECLRILKPEAPIKLTTPDMLTILEAWRLSKLGDFERDQPEYYKGATPVAQVSFLLFGSTGPSCTADNYEGHFHVYGREEMKQLLRGCGFKVEGQRSKHFHDTLDMGMSHSFAIEGVKP